MWRLICTVALLLLSSPTFRCGAGGGLFCFGGRRLGSLLCCIFLCALLRVYAQGTKVGGERGVGVEFCVEGGVVVGEPVGAPFGGAAVLTVLGEYGC